MNRWHQDKFYISTFEAIRADKGDFRKILKANQQAGIDIVELVFKNKETVIRILDVCEELGIPTIVQDPAWGGIGENIVTPDDHTVRESILHYSKYKCIFGYYLWDEPVEEAFDACDRTKKLFEKYVPEKLLFFTAFPSYGMYTWDSATYNWEENTYTAYIDRFLSTIDPAVVSFDYYPYRNNQMDIITSDLWRDMGYISKKSRALSKPFWFYFQGVDIETGVTSISRPKITAQMFSAIAYNAKGLSWFVTADVLTDLEGNKKDDYDILRSANLEAGHLGRFFFDKTAVKIYHTPQCNEKDQIYFLDNINQSSLIESAPDLCILSEFFDNTKNDYLLIVNKQHDNTAVGKIVLKKERLVAAFDKTSGTILPAKRLNEIQIELSAGDAAAFILYDETEITV